MTPSPRPRRVDPPPASPPPELHADTAGLRLVVRAVVAAILRAPFDDPDVEDCAHEALRRAMEGRERLREGAPLEPWVLGIARHVALDALRAKKRARRNEPLGPTGDDARGEPIPDPVARLVDPAPGPDDRALAAQRATRLRDALERLPENQARALRMFHDEGLGYQAIGRRLGVPLGTVATWIARGRRAIAEAIGEEVVS